MRNKTGIKPFVMDGSNEVDNTFSKFTILIFTCTEKEVTPLLDIFRLLLIMRL